MPDEERTLADLAHDPRNLRLHTPRNIGVIADALQEVGAARSIVVDEDLVVLAGNGVIEAAAEVGIEKVRIIDAAGDEIIAVRRRDLTPEQKLRLGAFDNRTAELSGWDVEALARELEQNDTIFDGMFHDEEMVELLKSIENRPDVEAPGDFASYDDDIATEYCCPKCGYEWSGKPK